MSTGEICEPSEKMTNCTFERRENGKTVSTMAWINNKFAKLHSKLSFEDDPDKKSWKLTIIGHTLPKDVVVKDVIKYKNQKGVELVWKPQLSKENKLGL